MTGPSAVAVDVQKEFKPVLNLRVPEKGGMEIHEYDSITKKNVNIAAIEERLTDEINNGSAELRGVPVLRNTVGSCRPLRPSVCVQHLPKHPEVCFIKHIVISLTERVAMGKCKVTVDAGVCRRITVIDARTNEDGYVEMDIVSDCPDVLRMSWSLRPEFAFMVAEAPMIKTHIYKLASGELPHAACPVPSAMLKALEAAGDLCGKRDVRMTIE
jgi:hypothetical protein